MQKIQIVKDYIINAYGFEEVPCSEASSPFQATKRDIFIIIGHKFPKLSRILFRLSPIKYNEYRIDGSFWFRRRLKDEKNGLCEISLKPIPVESTIYGDGISGLFKPDYSDNYSVQIYYDTLDIHYKIIKDQRKFQVNAICYQKQVDYYFCLIPELHTILRDSKLNQLLK